MSVILKKKLALILPNADTKSGKTPSILTASCLKSYWHFESDILVFCSQAQFLMA